MKTEFELVNGYGKKGVGVINIVGEKPNHIPYVGIYDTGLSHSLFIADKDLERFAVNILKALKSKKLKIK